MSEALKAKAERLEAALTTLHADRDQLTQSIQTVAAKLTVVRELLKEAEAVDGATDDG